jgi:membrane-associated phospholipid phosphatase
MHGALLLATLLSAPPADEASPFKVDLELDLQLTFTSVLCSIGPQFLKHTGDVASPIDTLPLRLLPSLDRNVVGNDSNGARGWSDRLLYVQLALPFAATFLDNLISDTPGGFSRFATEATILLEAATLTSMVTMLTKTAVARPRPFMYDPDSSLDERMSSGARESFFSGHTAISFSMATAYSYLYQKKHPDSPAVIPIWIGSHLVAGGVGLMRVQGGRHFWTDVVTGAAVGSAIGFLVPYFHQRGEDDGDGLGFDDIRIVPSVSSEFVGLHAMWFF